jgi:hypothetical protein
VVTVAGGVVAGLVVAKILRSRGGFRRLMPIAMAAAAVEAHLMRAARPLVARFSAMLAEKQKRPDADAAPD